MNSFTSSVDQSLIDNALSAFHVGMANLLVQVGHWNADYLSIIKSNLRLLHQSLLTIPDYRRQIKRLQRQGSYTEATRPYKIAHTLLQKYQHKTLTAPLTVPASVNPATITLHHQRFSPGTLSQIQAHLMCLPAGHNIRLPRPISGFRLYMPISGKVHTETEHTVNQSAAGSWWQRLTQGNSNQILKHGELLLSGSHQTSDIILKTERQPCILLCVTVKFSYPRTTRESSLHALHTPQPVVLSMLNS